MNDEKWFDIIENIESKFDVIDKTRQENPIGDDLEENKSKETIESIVFMGPFGKMKLERITRPVIIDKKAHYSKRAGDKARAEYTYSETEFSQTMKAYKWSGGDGEWVEIEANSLNF